MKKRIVIIITLFFYFVCNAQYAKMLALQNKYPNRQTVLLQKKYKKYKLQIRKYNFPPPPITINPQFERISKFYNIPIKQRLKLYPFNVYDSIYVCIPTLIFELGEPRDYLNSKYHQNIRLLSTNETDKLTDFLFNYEQMYALYREYRGQIYLGSDNIKNEYPKIILIFKKNGYPQKYMAFPDNKLKRTNLIEGDWYKYYNEFNLSNAKEDLILKLFGYKN